MGKHFKTKKMQLLDKIKQGGFIMHYKVWGSAIIIKELIIIIYIIYYYLKY